MGKGAEKTQGRAGSHSLGSLLEGSTRTARTTAASPFNVAQFHRSNVASCATKEIDFLLRRMLCTQTGPRDRSMRKLP